MRVQRWLVNALFCMGLSLPGQDADGVGSEPPRKPVGSTRPLSPMAEAVTFRLPPGFAVQLVAAEPLLYEPVMCTWDADGRMYVAEMMTYMQDIDGTGEDEPHSRVSVLHDDDGDGRMDRRTTFADGLLLPRLLLPLGDGVLIGETYTTALWLYRDVDRDGVSDGRELLRAGKKDRRNLEHQDSALICGIDNWLYTAMGGERLRLRQGQLISEEVDSEFAQWGLAVDDVGRQFLSSAGGERPAYGFQRHPRYGRASFGGELADGFNAVFPAIATPDVQGGESRVRADGTLNHMTGCCGQTIFRGTQLPADCVGDYFVCEPVGRLVRRASVRDVDGKIVLANRYQNGEFMTSTDMNFRPVWSATGPDGALYLVDMYRGIIQEGNWVKADSYLRPQVEKLGLQANIGRGRIWRITGEDPVRQEPLELLRADARALVAALAHDNGFWRDMAQQVLVQRGDRAVEEAVRGLAEHASPLGRVHALWTLEGLDALTRDDLARALRDQDARVRWSAVRASEGFLARQDQAVLDLLVPVARDPDAQVAAQLALSLRFAPGRAAREAILSVGTHRPNHEVVARAVRDSLRGDGGDAFAATLDADALALVREGKTHYQQLCIACHGADGSGAKAGDVFLGPPLVSSDRLRSDDALLRIVLHGLVGPVDGKVWGGGVMLGQGAQDDRYLAAVLSYVRTVLFDGGVVVPSEVAAVRAVCGERKTPWTLDELAPYAAVEVATLAKWTAAASHQTEGAARALDADAKSRFTTEKAMEPGMWWRVDLDGAHELTRVVLDTRGSVNDYPRGYLLEASEDGEVWRELARGAGDGPITSMRFAPTRLLHLRVTQTGDSKDNWWSIHRAGFVGRRL